MFTTPDFWRNGNVAGVYIDCCGENYTGTVLKKIRANPKAWLCSLPMYEYAHVCLVFTAHTVGGDPELHVKELYNKMLLPVVMFYYEHLEAYRVKRSIGVRKYWSLRKQMPEEGLVHLKCKMGICTKYIRALLRHICNDYRFLLQFGKDSVRYRMYLKMIQELLLNCEMEDWEKRLAEFMTWLQEKEGMEPEPETPEDPEDPGEEPEPEDPPEDPCNPGCDCTCDCCQHSEEN